MKWILFNRADLRAIVSNRLMTECILLAIEVLKALVESVGTQTTACDTSLYAA